MKKILAVTVLCLMFVLSLSACTKDEAADVQTDAVQSAVTVDQDNAVNDAAEQADTVSDDAEESSAGGTARSGEVFRNGDLCYNVIGVRTNGYDDGTEYLIVKLEVYNDGSGNVNYSTFDTLTVYGGTEEYSLDIFASVDVDLSGTITPGNKIMGEAAFDITDSDSDDYVLYIGSGFEYSPAISISADDIGKTFAEAFESSGVESEYTTGVPVESEQLTILLNSATIIPSDKDGLEILLLDLDVTNNESESTNFMLGINFDGVYTADGVKLDEAVNDWTLRSDMSAGETINGIASFYVDEGTKDFYMTVTPNLHDYTNTENIVFTAS